MTNHNSKILYQSQLSITNLVLMILGTLFCTGFGVNILWNAHQFVINWVLIIPLSSIILGVLIGYHTVILCTVIITKDYLILNYPLIGKKKYIAWKTISDAGMRIHSY